MTGFDLGGIIKGMDNRGAVENQPHQMDLPGSANLIQALSLEYQALTGEILTRTSGRFQFLGLMTTAAAIFAAGIGGSGAGFPTWLSVALAVAVLLLGLGSFLVLGRAIVRLSSRIAGIEARINQLLPAHPDGERVLSWETDHQQRSLIIRLGYGQFLHRL